MSNITQGIEITLREVLASKDGGTRVMDGSTAAIDSQDFRDMLASLTHNVLHSQTALDVSAWLTVSFMYGLKCGKAIAQSETLEAMLEVQP